MQSLAVIKFKQKWKLSPSFIKHSFIYSIPYLGNSMKSANNLHKVITAIKTGVIDDSKFNSHLMAFQKAIHFLRNQQPSAIEIKQLQWNDEINKIICECFSVDFNFKRFTLRFTENVTQTKMTIWVTEWQAGRQATVNIQLILMYRQHCCHKPA